MRKLTAPFAKTIRDPGRYGDGHGGYGLILVVRPRVAGGVRKSWIQRIRINGRPTHLGLGQYPLVGLADARQKAFENRQAIERGLDPRVGDMSTFSEVVERFLRVHEQSWRHSTKGAWQTTLQNYVLPALGNKRIDQITSGDVLAVVAPIWSSKPNTARKAKQRISAIMKWSIAEGHRPDNPAGEAITAALPKNTYSPNHVRAIPHSQLRDALERVRNSTAAPTVKLAVELVALTAARNGEVRGATWGEFDRTAAIWTVPAERTKQRRQHRVPLSPGALRVLDDAAEHSDQHDPDALVFPSRAGGRITNPTLPKLFNQLDIGTAHGLRSSFRDWCGETGAPREVAEACLAHLVGNAVEQAYARSDLLERRRTLMTAWAQYIGANGPA